MKIFKQLKYIKLVLDKTKLSLRRSDWNALEEADCLTVWHENDCGYVFKNKLYCGLILSITERLARKNISAISIVKPYGNLNSDNANGAPLLFNRDFFIAEIIDKINNLLFTSPKNKKYILWGRILDVVKPKYIIGIQPDSFLCKAARDRGIRIYDLQHGVISTSHAWYGKTAKELDAINLPTDFLCWDTSSASAIRGWAEDKGIRVHVTGNPWFQRFQCVDSEDQVVNELIRNNLSVTDDKPKILVTLQWGLERFYNDSDEHDGYLPIALKKLITSPLQQYNWLIRLHPVQLRGSERARCFQFLEKEFGGLGNVEWLRTSEAPLPLILSIIDLHITDMSSVVIEASWFGVPSALLSMHIKPGGRLEGYFDEQFSSGYAKVVKQDKSSIEAWITEQLSYDKERVPSSAKTVDILTVVSDGINNGSIRE
ncbi:hypothetical protein RE432_06310 [Pusillimonas sp. SM2304]|uniref:hypothetical protein n=1 Tax=Pusillimonas sp. SM2304 TaxID=3073241 RepID=UPI0028764481|nr:hypothetical protein [Pusillimonas sp. SM2304]MDS1140042.1 hypothetical protein [Pusillimonas sp. SM2304]